MNGMNGCRLKRMVLTQRLEVVPLETTNCEEGDEGVGGNNV